MKVSYKSKHRVNTFLVMLTRQISTDVNSFWQKWELLKLKESKQMLTSLVNKCLFAYRVNKHGGVYNTPMLTQVFTPGVTLSTGTYHWYGRYISHQQLVNKARRSN